jgi:hypothetical protein
MRSLKRDVKVVNAFDTQVINSDTTTDGDSIDLQDYDSCLFVLQMGTLTAGDATPIIEESDTGAFSGEENAVADSDLDGTEALAAFTDNADDNKVGTVAYIGEKRYVRLTIATTGTANLTIGGTAILGHGHVRPDTGNDAIA